MLTSLNWLKEYVNMDLTPVEIESLLTNSGTKVEIIEPINDVAKGIIAGTITKIEKHPQADRLQVCTVDIGDNTLTIITSATNVFEGAHVPVAVSGSTIADGTVMHDTEFRGINSQGMFCSVEELGMHTDLFPKHVTDGIYILPNTIAPGTVLRSELWIDDEIIDIELTANRGDCQSVYGIAREAAAAQGIDVKPLSANAPVGEGDVSDYLSVEVESELCPRYTGRVFRVNKIEPSPLWMQLKLHNSGVRPINNIVDVTNYVMLELGQPLHAFDYKSLGSDKIVVRTGNEEKTVVTLDEKERAITPDMLMITNGDHPVAVAGVMGGMNSEISDDTKMIVLESACFDKTSIRLTSKALGLRTEASARYEKGVYPELAGIASDRAAELFEEIGAATAVGSMIDVDHSTPENCIITVDTNWLNAFLGTDLSVNEIVNSLERLFLTVDKTDDHTISVHVPEYRLDLRIREDIAEEVARIYGYNNLPDTIMSGMTLVGEKTADQKYEDTLVNTLIGLGYHQTLTSSFTSENRIAALGLDPEDDKVKIINPLGEENSVMRSTLLAHQMELVSRNANRSIPAGFFFEIAKTYHKSPAQCGSTRTDEDAQLPAEEKHLVLSAYGADAGFFEMKGVVENLLALTGLQNVSFIAGGLPVWHPGRKAVIKVGDTVIGEMGEIHPQTGTNFDLPKRVYAAELNFDKLCELRDTDIHYADLPKFPGTERDLAIVLDKQVPAMEAEAIIRRNAGDYLEKLELFDVYTGEQVSEDKKSLAYNLKFRHPQRTLTDEDINPVIEAILAELKSELNAELRA